MIRSRTNQMQLTIFSVEDYHEKNESRNYNLPSKEIVISDSVLHKLQNYTLNDYIRDVETLGLEQTWDIICEFVLHNHSYASFLNINNFGELYEIGLAIQDKQQKKDSGQYYTPEDVAKVMGNWLNDCEGYNICDVACGTGKLILTFLEIVGEEEARKIIAQGRLYLYDLDHVALHICKTALAIKYGTDIAENIHTLYCDFLDKGIVLPANTKVISNPPYAAITKYENSWIISDVIAQTKEYYSAFMEKVFLQADSVVIITPFSFISGNKFYPLRKLMCEQGSGFIVSFDNVPGTIFNGRKQGIFNTNTSNSVRAAITVFRRNTQTLGFRTTHLIRFKAIERANLLDNRYLESLLSPEYQRVDATNPMFKKIDSRLIHIYNKWIEASHATLKTLLSDKGIYTISMPNTCRYFTVASDNKMNRKGQITLAFSDIDKFSYAFCLINSSFAYWHWRIYDGGITYPIGLLEELPIFFDKLAAEDKAFFNDVAAEMIANVNEYIVTKNNVGIQENIKYPRKYRDMINQRFFEILNINNQVDILDLVHSNMALEINV